VAADAIITQLSWDDPQLLPEQLNLQYALTGADPSGSYSPGTHAIAYISAPLDLSNTVCQFDIRVRRAQRLPHATSLACLPGYLPAIRFRVPRHRHRAAFFHTPQGILFHPAAWSTYCMSVALNYALHEIITRSYRASTR